MSEIPCRCGHLENVHPSEDGYIERKFIVCDACIKITRTYAGSCQKYNADNLSYIESLATKKRTCMIRKCVLCGHWPNEHYVYFKVWAKEKAEGEHHCVVGCSCEIFIADNLDYIEWLAKERNLI